MRCRRHQPIVGDDRQAQGIVLRRAQDRVVMPGPVPGIHVLETTETRMAKPCSRQAAALINPSAFIASCTLGRATMRSWNAFRFGHWATSISWKRDQLLTTKR